MSAAAIIAIAIGVVVVLAALVLRHARPPLRRARRRRAVRRDAPPRRAAREARRPRRSSRPHRRAARSRPQGELARYGTALAPVTARPRPMPWSPPDPEALGVSRRQFFNRATVTLTSAGIGAFSAAGFVAFLWPTATGGFGGRSPSASSTTSSRHPHRQRLLLRPRGPHVDHRVPGRRAAEGRRPCTPSSILAGMRAGHRRPLPEVPAPRLPRPAVRHEPVVRVPVPRLAVQPGRREEGRPGAARHGPLPGHRRRQRRRHRRHRQHRRRPADRHQHDRPGGRGPALHHRWW